MNADKYRESIVKLTDRDHILLRSGMYFSAKNASTGRSMFLVDGKFEYTEMPYIPGLIKIIYEAIDNSVDVAVKTEFAYANKIYINMDPYSVSISDNGYGISQQIDEDNGISSVVLAVGHARAGSNFDDNAKDRVGLGLNGIGIYLTNVFSKKFICTTSDGKNTFTATFINNAESYTTDIKPSKKMGTTIYFEPDIERFGITEIGQIHENIIKQRLLILAMTYPEISFYFNDEKIKFKNHKQFVEMFGDSFELISFENGFIAYFPSTTDEFNHFTILNGQVLTDGGNHVEYMNNKIVNYLREKISKKYKDIKPADIRNKLMLISLFRKFPNPTYSSQTKESLTNSTGEISKYLTDVDFDAIGAKIYKNQDIVSLITEMYKIREEFKKRQNLQKLGNKTLKVKSDKYWPSIGNKDMLILCEGDSARGGLMGELGRIGKGYFALRGKMLNVLEAKIAKISDNEEIDSLIKILGITINTQDLSNSGKWYKLSLDDKDHYLNQDDLFLDDNGEWQKNVHLNKDYNIIEIPNIKQVISPAEYYAQYRVNQPLYSNYDCVVAATDQDLDGCFTGDTLIKSLNGKSYSFKDLVDNKIENIWVYSKDSEGNMVPAIAKNPRITKYVDLLIELKFENGTIRCTPDHLILLNDNTYKKAEDLTVNDSISSLYFKNNMIINEKNNHKIVSSKIIKLDTPIPVYDVTVDTYHNFMIEIGDNHDEGIIVHNSHIRALILTLFNTFMPQLLKSGKVKYLQTPLIALKKNNKITDYFFTMEEYKEFVTNNPNIKGEWKYYKGLGSWAKNELAEIIQKDGIDKFLKTYYYDEDANEILFNWMSKTTSEYRKTLIKADYIDTEIA